MLDLIAGVKANRADAMRRLNSITETAKREGRSLNASEKFRFDTLETEIRALNERAAELEARHAADEAANVNARKYGGAIKGGSAHAVSGNGEKRATMPGAAYITSEPDVYRRENADTSFFMDMVNARKSNDRDALDRLDRNNRMQAERARANGEQRAISTTNGSGGEFVPPLWLETEFVKLARPRRAFADVVGSEPLPAGTDVINIPKVATGTATAVQGTQNTAIQQTDLTTTSISAPVVTVAGGQTVSLQLLEQSPLNIDDLILGDLAADYATKVDTLCLTGSGTGGNPLGALTLAGTNAVTFNGTTLTGAGSLYNAIVSGISKVFTSRFEAPNAIVMHPRRFAWMLAQQDTTGRPVIVPAESGPTNALGVLGPKLAADGPVGRMAGVDIFLDANIPVNLGAGSDQDRILILKSDDLRLWESHIRAEAFQQTVAQNMSVFVRLYNYLAFQPARYPGSISVISGTGLNLIA
ncbi:phage major capsid protein [Streptomyces sp. NPDC005506]|uniref:phage major capsid protein n=1 Tax=Streptomyces sp. NPDC005506 TaxID=3364718 RepID=UPI0036814FAE